jgi:signal transduction histidine kinase
VQEALSNVARHARAGGVTVTISGCDGPRVHVTIADDGDGFHPDRPREGGSGLAGMRERALLAGGRLDVRAAPGAGTTIELTLDAPDGAQR